MEIEKKDFTLRGAAKAYAALLTPVVLWVLTGVTTGSWEASEAVASGIAGLIMGVVVWLVPNREARSSSG